MNVIKQNLLEIGRYDDVKTLLTEIVNSEWRGTYPVHAYVTDDNRTLWRVKCSDVKEQAQALIELIDSEEITTRPDFQDLLQYVDTMRDIDLHNYANAISHKMKPDIDMEDIRVRSVTAYIIVCAIEDANEISCEIPKGWGKYPCKAGIRPQ